MNPLACLLLLSCFACQMRTSDGEPPQVSRQATPLKVVQQTSPAFDTSSTTIHIFVALCDNENQGIVRVPAKLGNGQDPFHNLYWGSAYGIKTYFKRSVEWHMLQSRPVDGEILERCIFKHKEKNVFIVADAYDGQFIKNTTIDFLRSSAGIDKDTLQINGTRIGTLGNAKLLAYIGHDGLMDFELNQTYPNADGQTRDVIILACYSRDYFQSHLALAQARPLVWTTGLMAPEAYTIHDALRGYIRGEGKAAIRERAAQAYARYQKCSVGAARGLLVAE